MEAAGPALLVDEADGEVVVGRVHVVAGQERLGRDHAPTRAQARQRQLDQQQKVKLKT